MSMGVFQLATRFILASLLGSYCCQDVTSFGNSLSKCLVFRQLIPFYDIFWVLSVFELAGFVCWAHTVVKMLRLSATVCQDVSSFWQLTPYCVSGWQRQLYVELVGFSARVLVLSKCLSATDCQDVFGQFTLLWYLLGAACIASPLLAAHPLLCGKLCILVLNRQILLLSRCLVYSHTSDHNQLHLPLTLRIKRSQTSIQQTASEYVGFLFIVTLAVRNYMQEQARGIDSPQSHSFKKRAGS